MKPILVCGKIEAEDSSLEQRSRCGAGVYPTIGSRAYARREELTMICEDCWLKDRDAGFAGMMHHGKMLPKAQAQFLLEEFLKAKIEALGRKSGC
jgi:hypothetical protein